MSLIKYNDLWDDSFGNLNRLFSAVLNEHPGYANSRLGGFRVDTYADDNGYYVVAEVPGIPKENINISLDNAVLTITGERKSGAGDDAASVKLSRSITVGDDVAADQVNAKLENGILTVTLPKSEERRPREIAISS